MGHTQSQHTTELRDNRESNGISTSGGSSSSMSIIHSRQSEQEVAGQSDPDVPVLNSYDGPVQQVKWSERSGLINILRDDESLRQHIPEGSQTGNYWHSYHTLEDWSPKNPRRTKLYILRDAFPGILGEESEEWLKDACIAALDRATLEVLRMEMRNDEERILKPIKVHKNTLDVSKFYYAAHRRWSEVHAHEVHIPEFPENTREYGQEHPYFSGLVQWTLRNIPDLPSIDELQTYLDSTPDEVKRNRLGKFYKSHADGRNLMPFVDGEDGPTLATHLLPMIPEFHYSLNKCVQQEQQRQPQRRRDLDGQPVRSMRQELPDFLERFSWRKIDGHIAPVLVSPTGTGKTAFMQRALCSTYGLYIANSTADDIGDMVDRCSVSLHSAVQTLRHTHLYATINQTVSCSLIARAIYLRALLVKHDKEWKRTGHGNRVMTPQQFLIAQIGSFTRHTERIFEQLMETGLQNEDVKVVEYRMFDVFNHLIKGLPRTDPDGFLFCVDDAHRHALPGTLGGQEIYSLSGIPRRDSLLAIQVRVISRIAFDGLLCGKSLGTNFAGTSFDADTHAVVWGKESHAPVGNIKREFFGLDNFSRAQEVIDFLELHLSLSDGCRQWVHSPNFSIQYLPMRRGFLVTVLEQLVRTATDKPRKERLHEAFSTTMQKMVHRITDQLFVGIVQKDMQDAKTHEAWISSHVQDLKQFVIHHDLRTSHLFHVQNNEAERLWIHAGLANCTGVLKNEYYRRSIQTPENVLAYFDATEPLAAEIGRATLQRLADRYPQHVDAVHRTVRENSFDLSVTNILGLGQLNRDDRHSPFLWATMVALRRFNGKRFDELPFLDQRIIARDPSLMGDGKRLRCEQYLTRETLFGTLRQGGDSESSLESLLGYKLWSILDHMEYGHLLHGVMIPLSGCEYPDAALICPVDVDRGDSDGQDERGEKKHVVLLIKCEVSPVHTQRGAGAVENSSHRVGRNDPDPKEEAEKSNARRWDIRHFNTGKVSVIRLIVSLHPLQDHTPRMRHDMQVNGVHLVDMGNMHTLYGVASEEVRSYLEREQVSQGGE